MNFTEIEMLRWAKVHESKISPLANKETASIGTSYNYSREDHVHPLEEATDTTLGAVKVSSTLPLADIKSGSIGTSMKYSREDHKHPLITATDTVYGKVLASTANPLENAVTASPGTSYKYSREDHKHPYSTLSYLKSSNYNGQTTNLAVNGIIAFDTAEVVTGSLFTITNNKVTIKQSTNAVRINIHVGKVDFTSAGSFYFRLYDETNSQLVGVSGGVSTVATTASTAGGSDIVYTFIPSAQTTLYGKITTSSGTPTEIYDSWIEVQEIPLKY